MTREQFLHKYQEYVVTSPEEAKWEADMVNQEGIEGDKVIAVEVAGVGWTLLLESGYDFYKVLGIVD